jgi:glycosyltransferase involved in cell wall biosynthesis
LSSDFPRILIVTSNNFNLVSGGGITLTNLFRGWPCERIANLHEDPTPEDVSVCHNFYRLTEEEIRWRWPFSLARRWYGRMKEQGNPLDVGAGNREPSPAKRWLAVIKQGMGEGVPKYARLTDRLMAWVQDFRPTLLYGFLGSLEQIDLTRQLTQQLQIPLVIHMMDDWPAVLYRRGWLAPLAGPMVRRALTQVLDQAAARLAICEAMCREYECRYGHTFLSFQNALDIERWLPFSRTNWKAGSPFLVRYVGSIVPDGQRESLMDIARAVAELSAEGVSIQLQIHAPRHESAYLETCGIPAEALHIDGPPDAACIASLLAGADLLVLPYNFDARSIRYIRLSLPTKAPAYMMSGTPILVYAPGEVATAEYAAREGWGYAVDSPGRAGLMAALKKLMTDEPLREHLGRRARHVAQANHDARIVRAAFWDAIRGAAGRSPITVAPR